MAVGLMAMPFSTVFVPVQNDRGLQVPAGMRNDLSNYRLSLPAGVVQVIVSWRGVDPILVQLTREGSWEVVHTISAVSTAESRTSGVLTFSSATDFYLELRHGSGGVWSANTLDRNYVAGVQVIPLSTPGGV